MLGTILYVGPSMLDGSTEIAAVLTYGSTNIKTGSIPQVWIFPTAVSPTDAVKTGEDAAVCGNCPLRPSLALPGASVCYVRMFQAPLSVFRAFHRGRHGSALSRSLRFAVAVRIGAWGDPAAVPMAVWEGLQAAAPHATLLGYTHQWRTAHPALAKFCMASTHTDAEDADAAALGWRVFRVVDAQAERAVGNYVTPSRAMFGALARCPSDAGWSRSTPVPCNVCKQCNGAGRSDAGRWIASHGIRRKAVQ